MSERPFMQLYVSDFVGDTLHLSTEQIGAYMLLLMAMWNAGGKLPADDTKLARVVRMSVKKWRLVSAELMPFFEVDGTLISHNRLTKELQKSESKSELRAAAGAKGGAAKALKNKIASVATATDLPQQNASSLHIEGSPLRSEPSPETRKAASQPRALEDLLDRLLEAAGVKGNPPQGLAFPGDIIALMQAGYDLEADILPAIRERPKPSARTWAYFVPQIREAVERRRGIAAEAKPDPLAALRSWPDSKWQTILEYSRDRREWSSTYGPPPFADGCMVPPHLLLESDRYLARIAA